VQGLEDEYTSLDEIIDGLRALERELRAGRDRRAVFTSAYLSMTEEVKSGTQEQRFSDGEWVARYAICFANLYRKAFLAFENGDAPRLPKPWKLSFETSRSGRALLVQDLLLGVNAHINHDLPIALVEASIDPHREKRRRDHFALNDAIRRATDPVQERIAALYAPAIELLDHALGRLDEDLANFSIEKARLNAWVSAIALTDAEGEAEAAAVRDSISDHASVMAKLILLPTPRRRVLLILRRLERLSSWWEVATR
jgi:hypothetical protein